MAGRTTNNRTADTLHVYGLLDGWSLFSVIIEDYLILLAILQCHE
jgi:hypothetical protein